MPRKSLATTRVLSLLAVLALTGPAVAGDAPSPPGPESAERADRMASSLKSGLMSPFCPGRTLSGCSSSNAARWRMEIDEWVQQGLSQQEITAVLQARVPDFTLTGTPRGHWRWSLAALAVAIATLVLAIYVRRVRRNATAAGAGATFIETAVAAGNAAFEDDDQDPLDDRLDDILDDELAALD